MRHLTVLLIKFITAMIAFGIGLDLFFDATFVDIVTFSIFITVASYLLGDLIILPQLGRRTALIVDFFLIYITTWVFGSVLLESYLQIAWGSIIAALIITVGEVFVHSFLADKVTGVQETERRNMGLNPKLAFGTEFAEEEDMSDITKTKNK